MVKVAIQGCLHGYLTRVYDDIKDIGGCDILLVTGDFQALRFEQDMKAISMPDKYKKLGDFHRYFNGELAAPCLTVFIGGNHEASNYMSELFYGGWVAKNIYYLGKAGVLVFKGLVISGISGIYKEGDHSKGHYEIPPYDSSSLRSVYHYRKFETYKLAELSEIGLPIDIFLSHDWPNNIEKYGNTNGLLKKKHHFREQVQSNTLGSPSLQYLLNQLKPKFWFAGHLHVYFAAYVLHNPVQSHVTNFSNNQQAENNPDEIDLGDFNDNTNDANPDEIDLDFESNRGEISEDGPIEADIRSPKKVKVLESVSEKSKPDEYRPIETHFLALDKPLDPPNPKRIYLEIKEIFPSNLAYISVNDDQLYIPITWLAITKAYHRHMSKTRFHQKLNPVGSYKKEIDQALQELSTEIPLGYSNPHSDKGLVKVPDNFVPYTYEEGTNGRFSNLVTDWFCKLVGIENCFSNPTGYNLGSNVI